jgi:hypothetical protein
MLILGEAVSSRVQEGQYTGQVLEQLYWFTSPVPQSCGMFSPSVHIDDIAIAANHCPGL